MDRWGQIHVDLRTYGEVFTLQMWVITICNILLRRCVIYFKILYAKGSDYYTASVRLIELEFQIGTAIICYLFTVWF